eukprot:Awhi_evm1s3899
MVLVGTIGRAALEKCMLEKEEQQERAFAPSTSTSMEGADLMSNSEDENNAL